MNDITPKQKVDGYMRVYFTFMDGQEGGFIEALIIDMNDGVPTEYRGYGRTHVEALSHVCMKLPEEFADAITKLENKHKTPA